MIEICKLIVLWTPPAEPVIVLSEPEPPEPTAITKLLEEATLKTLNEKISDDETSKPPGPINKVIKLVADGKVNWKPADEVSPMMLPAINCSAVKVAAEENRWVAGNLVNLPGLTNGFLVSLTTEKVVGLVTL